MLPGSEHQPGLVIVFKNVSAHPLRVALAVSCIVLSACGGRNDDPSEDVDESSGGLSQGALVESPVGTDGADDNSNAESTDDSNIIDGSGDADTGNSSDNAGETDSLESSAGDSVVITDPTGGGENTDDSDGTCLLYTSPSPRDRQKSRMPSSA